MRSLKANVTLGFLLAFAAGVAVGAVANRRSVDAADATYLATMADQYELSSDQVRAIRGHLDVEKTHVDAILARLESEVGEQIQRVREEAERKIREELTEEQKTAFDRDRAGD